jgi:glycosyltransferase involved in cell wall biosynthesis
MKIAVFIKSTTYHKGHGGLETQNKVLCEGLVSRGHSVTVFSQKRELDFTTKSDKGVEYVFIPCQNRYFFSDINPQSWQNQSLSVFSKMHKDTQFDLVIGQSSGAIGIILRKDELGVKVISIAHGTTLGEFTTAVNNLHSFKDLWNIIKNSQYVFRQYFGRQRDYILKSNKIIAVSTAVKTGLIEETYIPENRIEIINNGIDPDKVKTSLLEKRNFNGNTVFYIGQINKDKGIDFLVKTFIQHLQSDSGKTSSDLPSLLIAGDGPILANLKELVIESGTSENITFLNKIPYDTVYTYYNDTQVSIFAFPTNRVEGFPMVIAEAMFVGLPVVAFNCGGVSDAVINNETGYLIKAGDKLEFTNKLFSLLNNHSKLEEFSQKAKEKANKEFTINVMIDKYEKVFKEVL